MQMKESCGAVITEVGEEKQFNQLFLKHCHTVDAKS